MGDVFPVSPRKINVKIGRVDAVEVDKALKVKVEFHGIHIGNAQEVGHNAVGATASPHIEVPLAAGVVDDVPVDQEVRDKPLDLDQFQFFLDPVFYGLTRLRIAVGQALPAEAFDQLFVFLHTPRIASQVLGLAFQRKVEFNLALLEQSLGILEDEGVVSKGPDQVFEGVHLLVFTALFFRGKFTEEYIFINGPEQAVGVVVSFVPKTHRLLHH